MKLKPQFITWDLKLVPEYWNNRWTRRFTQNLFTDISAVEIFQQIEDQGNYSTRYQDIPGGS